MSTTTEIKHIYPCHQESCFFSAAESVNNSVSEKYPAARRGGVYDDLYH